MIESIENALQIIVLLICSGIALYRAIANHSQTWVLAFLFFGSWLLGDIYWLVCLLFYGQTPQISIVSDLSWYGSYIFLYLLLYHSSAPDKDSRKHRLPWLGPVFAAGMAVFFITQGELLSNLIYASLMGLLLFSAVRRMTATRRTCQIPHFSESGSRNSNRSLSPTAYSRNGSGTAGMTITMP